MSMKAINSKNGHWNTKQCMYILCVYILSVCMFSRRKKSFSRWEESLPRFQLQGPELISPDKVKGTTWSDTQREIFP